MILIDTGPLVALCNDRDALHAAALAEIQTLRAEKLTTCESVLIESCFQLRHAMLRRRLQGLLDQLEVAPTKYTDDQTFWRDVFEWMEKYADHAPDWADACISVLCGRDRKLKVWTYDREFRTIWRRPDGSAVPMAVKI